MTRALLVVLLAVGCDDPAAGSDADAALPSATASAPVADERVQALRKAEVTRRSDAVTDEDLASRNVLARRAAARALARAQSPAARDGLLRLLSDEDEEVVAWAAYGLGDHCTGRREATVSALSAAAAARSVVEPAKAKLSAQSAITRAVGRCASPQSEPTLTGWARRRDAHAVDAVFALGDVATQHKKLREETFVALLEIAAGTAAHPALPEALYPFGRVDNVPPSVIERALEVARARLKHKGPARIYAVRTLARGDDAAVPILAEILQKRGEYTTAERVEAARGLGRLGRNGQRALGAALDKLFPADGLDAKLLASAEIGVLTTALTSITDMRDGARRTLERIGGMPAPSGATPALTRRVSWLRCMAAGLVVEREFERPLLLACDLAVPESKRGTHPLPSTIGARSVVAALGVDGVKITGRRREVWKSYATAGDLRARAAALELIGAHDELSDAAPEVLAAALSAAEPGLVGSAAQVIAKHPERVRVETKKGAGKVDARVMKALVGALEKSNTDLEMVADVVQAVAALGLDQTKGRLLELCSSPHAVLRDKSHAALARLLGGASKVRCKPHAPLPAAGELDHLVTAPVRIELDSDAGKLTLELDPELAPVAVTRVVDLVKSGFYNGMIVHRVVPAFVSQFGSPTADGYGGAPGKPALPCETSPVSYGARSVGVALAGRDTGSSQLFVSHVATPHLDGKYALLGKAEGAWDALVDGDVIRKARLIE